MSEPTFSFACPICRGRLEPVPADAGPNNIVAVRCETDRKVFPCEGGIWHFLTPDLAEHYSEFGSQYEAVREAEGWGADDADYYRALPFEDLTGRFIDIWEIRARSYRTFRTRVLLPQAAHRQRDLQVIDAGAGNCWLSGRLARDGHHVAAVDLLTGGLDGLDAATWYGPEVEFLRVQASFDRLPFGRQQADLVVFNGAFHYSTDYAGTFMEALRVLRPDGLIVILDTPFFREKAAGDLMLEERWRELEDRFGFASPALPHEGYVTADRMGRLAGATGTSWHKIEPDRGFRRTMSRWKARVSGRRAPADFPLIVVRRDEVDADPS